MSPILEIAKQAAWGRKLQPPMNLVPTKEPPPRSQSMSVEGAEMDNPGHMIQAPVTVWAHLRSIH